MAEKLAVTASPTDTWRLNAGYGLSFQEMRGPVAASRILARSPPQHQVVLRSSHTLKKTVGVGLQARYVDAIEAVPGYLAVDIRMRTA